MVYARPAGRLASQGLYLEVISTGSLSMDVSTGIGGIPKGRITEVYGPDGAGKTTLGLSISREAIRSGQKVLYVDIESTLTFPYVNIPDVFDEKHKEQFVVIHPETGDSALSIIEKAIRLKEFDLIILDSVAALVIEKELEDELGDRHIGLLPTLLSSFLRRNILVARKNKVALVFLNQVRAKIGSYIQTVDSPGGYALKHFTSLRILVTGGKMIKSNGEDGEIIGNMVNFSIRKNKLASPYRSFVIPLYYTRGFDYYEDAVKFATELGVIKKRGAYRVFEDTTLGLGIIKSALFLKENKNTLDKIIEMCYNTMKLSGDLVDLEGEVTNGEGNSE